MIKGIFIPFHVEPGRDHRDKVRQILADLDWWLTDERDAYPYMNLGDPHVREVED